MAKLQNDWDPHFWKYIIIIIAEPCSSLEFENLQIFQIIEGEKCILVYLCDVVFLQIPEKRIYEQQNSPTHYNPFLLPQINMRVNNMPSS